MNLCCVPPDRASEFYPLARSYVEAAIKKIGLGDPVQVEFDVTTGQALLWLATDGDRVLGAGVTQFMHNKRVCLIVAWGSDDHAQCGHLLADIEAFARAEGCKSVRLVGRQGWSRRLPPDYRLKAVVLEKAI